MSDDDFGKGDEVVIIEGAFKGSTGRLLALSDAVNSWYHVALDGSNKKIRVRRSHLRKLA